METEELVQAATTTDDGWNYFFRWASWGSRIATWEELEALVRVLS